MTIRDRVWKKGKFALKFINLGSDGGSGRMVRCLPCIDWWWIHEDEFVTMKTTYKDITTHSITLAWIIWEIQIWYGAVDDLV